jgi:hypothetical protein
MPTIEHALQRFLELEREQHPDEAEDAQLVIDNLRSFLDGYGYQYVEEDQEDDDGFDDDDYDEGEGDFASSYDSAMLPQAMSEFLYYWNIRKYMGSADDAQATGVLVTRLMELLATEGWADREEANEAAEMARIAADELPRAKQLSDLLYDVAAATQPARADEIEEDVDDFLVITKVEPGRLWFTENVGPIEVPEAASELAHVGWWVNLAAQRRAGTWFITETGSVYPRMLEEEDEEDEEDDAWGELFPGSPSSLN